MKKLILLFAIIATLFSSCKDSEVAQFSALGKHHIISLYATNGTVIKTWESTGNVSNEEHSDGWYFEDLDTGKLVEIAGTMIITVK
jgi:hypothetical protein